MFDAAYFKTKGLSDIYDKVMACQRLDASDGLRLFEFPELEAVGALAAHVRFTLHGNNTTYVVNRQINYTNVCVNGCLFCAFRRDDESRPGAFVLGHDEILERIAAAYEMSQGLDEMHMVGGCHPRLDLPWFEGLFRKISARFPHLPIKAFTPVEIAHFAQMEGISTLDVLQRLRSAGLRMLPGGGAEIFAEDLRAKICPHKADAAAWLRISGEAHSLGMPSNCTMLFGHWETPAQRVDHLLRLREQQDKSGGFTCFIPLPFLKKNSLLKLPPQQAGPGDCLDQLRVMAVSRLLLDNIPHIKAYWIMLGVKLAQTALLYGADDLDGTIVEERIGHMAGAASAQGLTLAQLEEMIRASGFTPRRRNAVFKTVPTREVA